MFFTHISQLMTQGVDLTIVIRRKENELIVSTLPKSNGLKDDAQHLIVPLTLTGTPAELDAGFMQTIAQPVQKATGLIVNLEQFEQQMTKASASSKAAKEAQAKESKEEREKRERYEKSIKRADDMIAINRLDDALLNLQAARLNTTEQTKKTVDEKIAEVKAKLNQGSLFAMEEVAPIQPPQPQMHIAPPEIQQQAPQMQQQRPEVQQHQASHQAPQATAIPATLTMRFEDQYPYPSAATQAFDPSYCRPDEYEAYPDFPVNMNAPMCNHPQTF